MRVCGATCVQSVCIGLRCADRIDASDSRTRRAMNKHGLSRTIPEPVKREVRQACGFGCVFCGHALVEYEHVDPLFADARLHDFGTVRAPARCENSA